MIYHENIFRYLNKCRFIIKNKNDIEFVYFSFLNFYFIEQQNAKNIDKELLF